MEKFKDKVKKNKVDWPHVLYCLNKPGLWSMYMLFRQEHPKRSLNRCAYYVLQKYYSTTIVRQARYFYKTEGLTSCLLYFEGSPLIKLTKIVDFDE